MNYTGIAISGKLRSGKDTLAANLFAADPRFTRVGIADQVKHECNQLFSGELDFFDEATKNLHRDVLIAVGKAGRAIKPDYWLDQAVIEANSIRDPIFIEQPDGSVGPGIPVITDCRFKNEADRLKAEGFLLVRLDVSEASQIARGGLPNGDPTETDLDDYDDWDIQIITDDMSADLVVRTVATYLNWPDFDFGLDLAAFGNLEVEA